MPRLRIINNFVYVATFTRSRYVDYTLNSDTEVIGAYCSHESALKSLIKHIADYFQCDIPETTTENELIDIITTLSVESGSDTDHYYNYFSITKHSVVNV